MINEFVKNELNKAIYTKLDDGTIYGEIKSCKGVWANAKDLKDCKAQLAEVLEEWLLLKVYTREKVPSFNFFKMKLPKYA